MPPAIPKLCREPGHRELAIRQIQIFAVANPATSLLNAIRLRAIRATLILMSAQEEVEEHVHHARDRFEKLVAGNMAIVAALLAIVSVLGQHYNTEELLKQQESSDQWAFYQAKSIRLYIAQSTQDLMTCCQC